MSNKIILGLGTLIIDNYVIINKPLIFMIPDTRHKSHKSCKLFVTDLTLIGSSMILLSLSYNSTFIIPKMQEDCNVFFRTLHLDFVFLNQLATL